MSREVVRELVAGVHPCDDREAAHRTWMLDWVDSGAQLYRLVKPVTPPQHLVVYAILLDETDRSMMLVAHNLARAWLPPGGHVDDGEDPRRAVVRELEEELGITPPLHPAFGPGPFFLTVTATRPPDTHEDATMWFVFDADRDAPITPDEREFSAVRWFSLDATEMPGDGPFDPSLFRFLRKVSAHLA